VPKSGEGGTGDVVVLKGKEMAMRQEGSRYCGVPNGNTELKDSEYICPKLVSRMITV
jgi:hypothetical protein